MNYTYLSQEGIYSRYYKASNPYLGSFSDSKEPLSLAIIGSNERALSLAILALRKGLKVYLIADWHLSSRVSLENETLRQPLTFDLVSFLSRQEFNDWRLDKYLGLNYNYNSLDDAERAEGEVLKDTYDAYLDQTLQSLEKMGLILIEDSVLEFSNHYIKLVGRRILKPSYIAFCNTEKRLGDLPSWFPAEERRKVLGDLRTHIDRRKILVIGDDEYSIKYALELHNQNHDVYIVNNPNKGFSISKYELPCTEEWSDKSALGSYFRSFQDDLSLKQSYYNKLESFTRKLTTNTYNSLLASGIKFLEYKDNSDNEFTNNLLLERFDFYINLSKKKVSVSQLPDNECITVHPDNKDYPLLMDGLRQDNLYFSGTLAEFFDGPRQRSVISSGTSAKEIVDSIISRTQNV